MSRNPGTRATPFSYNGLHTARTAVIGLARAVFLSASAAAAPLKLLEHNDGDDPDGEGTALWVLYVASMVLVLLGGAFAGLTIALMGQDGIYLQVLAQDENDPQQKNARRVYDLLNKGKHWVLVTLLLSNVIVNETLPVVLDRCFGGGVAAVVGSTFLIVIFGEILPQSVCVRYGLQIGGYMSKPVLLLMWLMAPLAWPTAKLLDWILGKDEGTVYKKSGLKTLVTLHRNLGEVLNKDEVTIISAVLDLKEKPVENVMTPMDDVFTMSEDDILDEKSMDMILSAGYSRIPIHDANNPTNFVGMLLVKILITYDPEDARSVRDFALAALPETRPETSCLDIVNYFQEGKSHMVLVSEYPGQDHGAIGVVTLEDVIEELIGEEIIDESDVYVDVHKAIRRLTPAPKARVQRRLSGASPVAVASSDDTKVGDDENANGIGEASSSLLEAVKSSKGDIQAMSSSPKHTTFLMRRSSAGLDGKLLDTPTPIRANIDELKQHLRHLGPSNPASHPKETKSTTVKVKPGLLHSFSSSAVPARSGSLQAEILHQVPEDGDGDETTHLLRPQLTGKDGVRVLRQSYGAAGASETQHRLSPRLSPASADASPIPAITIDMEDPVETEDHATQTSSKAETVVLSEEALPEGTEDSIVLETSPVPTRSYVRSGSITENIVETRGIRKVVLETTSSTDEEEGSSSKAAASPKFHRSRSSANVSTNVSDVEEEGEEDENGDREGSQQSSQPQQQGKKKNRRKKRKGGKP